MRRTTAIAIEDLRVGHRLPAGRHARGDARGRALQRDHRRRLHRPRRRRLPDAGRPPLRRPHRLPLLRPRLGPLRPHARRARRATEREVRILPAHLEASLLAERQPTDRAIAAPPSSAHRARPRAAHACAGEPTAASCGRRLAWLRPAAAGRLRARAACDERSRPSATAWPRELRARARRSASLPGRSKMISGTTQAGESASAGCARSRRCPAAGSSRRPAPDP